MKYIFDNVGDISVGTIDLTKLANSGLEVISRNGAVNTTVAINAMYFGAVAQKDINVTSAFLGGASFESYNGNITFNHNGGPIKISGLKALNGNIDVKLTLPGNLYISGLASNNPVKLNVANADTVSLSGSGETALNIDLTNGNGKYKLISRNDRDLTINNTGNTFTDLKLYSGGNLNLTGVNGSITADNIISLEGNNINGNTDLALTGPEVYLKLREGTQNYEISADKVDLNGNNLNVTLLKDTQLTDVDLDESSGNVYGTLNINTDKNVSLDGQIYVENLNINSLGFDFGANYSIMDGNNISITAANDITGIGKITAYKVNMTGNTIGAASPLVVNADFANFTSTATKKTANDTLININTNNWVYGYKNYVFKTSGEGISYIGGRKIDYAANQQMKESRIRAKLPIEATNIDMVEGDDLIKGGRLLDPSELITVEKSKPDTVKSIKKRNKNIELK